MNSKAEANLTGRKPNRNLPNSLLHLPITTVGRDPVAVPEKIFGLTLILDFFDRCHSLVSLPPPQAAVDSLPTGRAVCEAADRLQNDLLYVGRRQYLVAYATRRARWSRPTVVIGRAANCSANSCLTG